MIYRESLFKGEKRGGDWSKKCWNKMCLTLPLKVLSDNKVLRNC